jgi:hypothetical protein
MDQRGRSETFTSLAMSVPQQPPPQQQKQQQQQQQQQQQRPAPAQSVCRDRSLAARENGRTNNRFSRKYLISNIHNKENKR